MWLAEVVAEVGGARPISPDLLSRLPLRVRALLDVAERAGLGAGRTRLAMLQVLIGQSIIICVQFRRENALDQVVRCENQQPLDVVVRHLVEVQRENRELRQVFLSIRIYFYFCIFIFVNNSLLCVIFLSVLAGCSTAGGGHGPPTGGGAAAACSFGRKSPATGDTSQFGSISTGPRTSAGTQSSYDSWCQRCPCWWLCHFGQHQRRVGAVQQRRT
jgi:hypothetical protein